MLILRYCVLPNEIKEFTKNITRKKMKFIWEKQMPILRKLHHTIFTFPHRLHFDILQSFCAFLTQLSLSHCANLFIGTNTLKNMKNSICPKSFAEFQAKVVFFTYRKCVEKKKCVSKCLENYGNFVGISFGKIWPSVKWKTIFGRECCRWLIWVGNLLNWLLHIHSCWFCMRLAT